MFKTLAKFALLASATSVHMPIGTNGVELETDEEVQKEIDYLLANIRVLWDFWETEVARNRDLLLELSVVEGKLAE